MPRLGGPLRKSLERAGKVPPLGLVDFTSRVRLIAGDLSDTDRIHVAHCYGARTAEDCAAFIRPIGTCTCGDRLKRNVAGEIVCRSDCAGAVVTDLPFDMASIPEIKAEHLQSLDEILYCPGCNRRKTVMHAEGCPFAPRMKS